MSKCLLNGICLNLTQKTAQFRSIHQNRRNSYRTIPILIIPTQIHGNLNNFLKTQIATIVVKNHVMTRGCCSLIYFLRNHVKISSIFLHNIIHNNQSFWICKTLLIFNIKSVINFFINHDKNNFGRIAQMLFV